MIATSSVVIAPPVKVARSKKNVQPLGDSSVFNSLMTCTTKQEPPCGGSVTIDELVELIGIEPTTS